MKKLSLLLCLGFLFVQLQAQKGASISSYLDSTFFKVSKHPGISGEFKSLNQRTMNKVKRSGASGIFNDTILNLTNRYERAIAAGKARGVFDPDIVRTAKRKYPGNSQAAVINRFRMYRQSLE